MSKHILNADKRDECFVSVMINGKVIDYRLTAKDNGLQIDALASDSIEHKTATKVSYFEHPNMKE